MGDDRSESSFFSRGFCMPSSPPAEIGMRFCSPLSRYVSLMIPCSAIECGYGYGHGRSVDLYMLELLPIYHTDFKRSRRTYVHRGTEILITCTILRCSTSLANVQCNVSLSLLMEFLAFSAYLPTYPAYLTSGYPPSRSVQSPTDMPDMHLI